MAQKKSQAKKPLLFIDTIQQGCLVTEQEVFMTPYVCPEDISEADFTRTYAKGSASDLNQWLDEE